MRALLSATTASLVLAHRAGQRPRLPFLSRGTNATLIKDAPCPLLLLG